MRIALLTDGIYPYLVGGMQKHSYNLAKYFAQQKIYIDLYHCNSSQTNYNIQQLDVFTEEEKKHIRSIVIDFPVKGYYPGHYVRESYKYSESLYQHLMQNPLPDFIYAQGFCAWKSIKEKKKGAVLPPIAVNFHGLEMFQLTLSLKARLQQLLLRSSTRFNLLNADYVINYGGKIAELLLSLGCKQQQLITSPNATETKWLEQTATTSNTVRKFLFIGRYERRKGVQELSTVLKQLLADTKANFEFHFVGPIPDEVKISKPNIIYHGSVIDFDAIKKIIRSVDVLVCPSLAEGMPTVIVEAMASGLAIIATDTGGTQSLVSEKTGWLIEPGSESQLKNALKDAINVSNEVLSAKKENAIQLIKDDFLWERVIDKSILDIKKICKIN